MSDRPDYQAWAKSGRNTAKTPFVILADLILHGAFRDHVPMTLEQIQQAMPYPAERAPSNGVTSTACSPCGRGGVPLRLDMQDGWLCARCAKERGKF